MGRSDLATSSAASPASPPGWPRHFDELPLPALDSLRFFAVFVVIVGHANIYRYPVPPAQGVTCFFVLSGFLITWLLLLERRNTNAISLKKFYARRALRLFPAFYFFFFVYLLIDWRVRGSLSWAGYLSAFFYYLNYYSAIFSPPHLPMAHTWSLATEEQFYLLWPGVFKRVSGSSATLVKTLVAVLVFGSVYRPILSLCHVSSNYIFNAFEARASQLATGCLLAVLIQRGMLPRAFDMLFRHSWAVAVVLGLLLASIVADYRWPHVYSEFVGYTLDPILYAVLLGQAVVQSSGLFRVLNWAPLRFVGGKLSYAMYLWHWLIDFFVATYTTQYPSLARVAMALIGTMVLAFGSYMAIERPFLRMKTRFRPDPVPL